jgi:hypothetical protein
MLCLLRNIELPAQGILDCPAAHLVAVELDVGVAADQLALYRLL